MTKKWIAWNAPLRRFRQFKAMPFAPVTIRGEAAAKINLSLDVFDRRNDSYHNIDSVMQAVSLADGVTIAVAPLICPKNKSSAGVCHDKSDHLTNNRDLHRAFFCQESSISIELQSTRPVPMDETNTAVKAAKLWCQQAGATNLKIEIYLEKHIPTGAGLGGGSSDAATVLRLLNQLAAEAKITAAPLSSKLLPELAAMIGADVPFCLHGGIARCRGIGEIVEPLGSLPKWFLILAIPPFSFSTAERFRELDQLDKECWRHPDTESLLKAIDSQDLAGINETAFNVFSNLQDTDVISLETALLETGADMVRMTGSGPVVFALYAAEKHRSLSLQRLKASAHKDTMFLPAYFKRSASSF